MVYAKDLPEPLRLRIEEHNAFYESLSHSAQEHFLATLEQAVERGADEDTAWREAVEAAETTYDDPTRQP